MTIPDSVGGAEAGGAQTADGGFGGPDAGGFSDALGAATDSGGWDSGGWDGDVDSNISADPGGWQDAATPTAGLADAPNQAAGTTAPEPGMGGGDADLAFMASMGTAALSVPWWSDPYGQVDEAADWLIAPDGALLVPLRPDQIPDEALLVPAGGPLTPVLIIGGTLIYRVGSRLYRLVRPGLPRVLDPQVLQPLADPSQLRPLDHATARRIMEFLEARPPGHVMHHLVPQGDPIDAGRDATPAQQRLRELDIGPHDPEVLMWVPEEYHWVMHTRELYNRVNETILRARTPDQGREELARLREEVDAAVAAWRRARAAAGGSAP